MQLKLLGMVEYGHTYAAMQAFTAQRSPSTEDELWLCQHPAVYTQGLAGKPEHVLGTTHIPVIQTDRGGQVTYHGPGQVVAYPLVNLHRLGIFVKEYVYRIESAVLVVLAHYGITGHRVVGAPGIYVRLDDPRSHAMLPKSDAKRPDFTGLGKIAALGIKVSKGCTYHGVSLNVAVDLQAFSAINPCGYAGLQAVDLVACGVDVSADDVAALLASKLQARLV
jgi:lipoyl(octanoyl) transferase